MTTRRYAAFRRLLSEAMPAESHQIGAPWRGRRPFQWPPPANPVAGGRLGQFHDLHNPTAATPASRTVAVQRIDDGFGWRVEGTRLVTAPGG